MMAMCPLSSLVFPFISLHKKSIKDARQAGAELGQAQIKLELGFT